MMKSVFFGLVSALLFACTPQSDSTPKLQQTFYIFGTAVTVEILNTPKPKGEAAIHAIEADFQSFNREWHAWEKGGLVSKINDAIRTQTPITVPASVKAFIQKSQQLAEASHYLFDPGIGSLVALWGFHSEGWQGPPPSPQAIRHWLERRPSIADIHFDHRTLLSNNPDVRLDFGGNAKGLALDRAIHTLKQAGIENAIVNIGGDMRVIGSNHGQPWRIGIQSPFQPSQPIGSVELSKDISIVTSGSYQRYFEWNGKRYSHILNPNTGYPADHFVSVTVIHPDATTADAAATALMIAGPEHWQTIAASMQIEEAFMIDASGQYYMTERMKHRLKLLN